MVFGFEVVWMISSRLFNFRGTPSKKPKKRTQVFRAHVGLECPPGES